MPLMVNWSYFYSKVSRPDKLAVHVFEVDEDVDKDEVSLYPTFLLEDLKNVRYHCWFFLQPFKCQESPQ